MSDNIRALPNPHNSRQIVLIDLDSDAPLTDNQREAIERRMEQIDRQIQALNSEMIELGTRWEKDDDLREEGGSHD